jgi:zinc/manganese transport system substrate-binding protein
MPSPYHRRASLALLVAMLYLLAACGGGAATPTTTSTTTPSAETTTTVPAATTTTEAPEPAPDLPLVVATTSIWGDVVAAVAGDQVRLEVIMPLGADPHDFVPSSAQVALLQQADLVVANGLGLEEGLLDVLEAVADQGVTVLEVAPLVDPIPFSDDDDHDDDHDHDHDHDDDDHDDDDHDEHDHDGDDPHVWQDPLRVADAARAIGIALSGIVTDASAVTGAAEAYAVSMTALADEIEVMLEGVPEERRLLLTNHHSLGYFADRFGFDVVGTVIPGGSTLADPSSAEVAALVRLIEDLELPAIFVETVSPSALADALAAEVDHEVAVVELFTDSLGPAGSGADTLTDLLRTNASRIAEALG